MAKTLFEKLDGSSAALSLKESVYNQVQRIISTRTYLGSAPEVDSYVSGFGVPEIVDKYATSNDDHQQFRRIIRQQILALEPRVKEVEVKAIYSHTYRASCQLLLQLEEGSLDEQFFF